jgi:hypothetical protein
MCIDAPRYESTSDVLRLLFLISMFLHREDPNSLRHETPSQVRSVNLEETSSEERQQL